MDAVERRIGPNFAERNQYIQRDEVIGNKPKFVYHLVFIGIARSSHAEMFKKQDIMPYMHFDRAQFINIGGIFALFKRTKLPYFCKIVLAT